MLKVKNIEKRNDNKMKKRKGVIAANFSMLSVGLFLLVGTIFAVGYITQTSSSLTGSKLSTAVDEATQLDAMAKEYSVIGTSRGSGYSNINAEAAVPYSSIGLKKDPSSGTGAASRIMSNTSFGTKIKYDLKANSDNETYNILIDASGVWGGWDNEQKIKYVTGIARAYQKLNMRPADNIGNIVSLGATTTPTTISAVPSATVDNAAIIGDTDGVFALVYLGK